MDSNSEEIKQAFARLSFASEFDETGNLRRPLDILSYFRVGLQATTLERDRLLARFINSPIIYWEIARWGRLLDNSSLAQIRATSQSEFWEFQNDTGIEADSSFERLIHEIAHRFDNLSCPPYPFRSSGQALREKYEGGLWVAKEIFRAAHLPRPSIEMTCGDTISEAWREWVALNIEHGKTVEQCVKGIALAAVHNTDRLNLLQRDELGCTPILLEQNALVANPFAATLRTQLFPLPPSLANLDGLIVPNIPNNGLLTFSEEFLTGIYRAWDFTRQKNSLTSPTMLCVSVEPNERTSLHTISGRSAEMSFVAAFDSVISGISLRSDVAVSAALELEDGETPTMGTVSFGSQKFLAAKMAGLEKVLVSTTTAKNWQKSKPESLGGFPDVLSAEFYQNDILPAISKRSQRKVAITVPTVVFGLFAIPALLIWQPIKYAAEATRDLMDPVINDPTIELALVFTELACLVACVAVLAKCISSMSKCFDSFGLTWLCLFFCFSLVVFATFVPCGVRWEGLIDNPIYSPLLGEPQVTRVDIRREGGEGLLWIHTLTQLVGFGTTLYGVSSVIVYFRNLRSVYEPRFDKRVGLVKEAWRFSRLLMVLFSILVFMFCVPRNLLWYYYIAYLPNISLGFRSESVYGVIATLCLVAVVLVAAVNTFWAIILSYNVAKFIEKTKATSGRSTRLVSESLPVYIQATVSLFRK